jgi:hypothetical protein
LAAEDPDSVQAIGFELQEALHSHIEKIRDKVTVLTVNHFTPSQPAA